ncbi:MAG: TerC family protein [Xanthobacteraceae bacterium]
MDWSEFSRPQFWFAVVQIIWINILLSGDNAVVIALACRRLPPRERVWGMVIGAGVASVLLVVFTGVATALTNLPFFQLVGGCALLWIATKLLIPEEEHEEGTVQAVEDLWRAVRIVVLADIVMSLDNVVAVAGAAQHRMTLMVIGLSISIPMVIAGAALITALLERFPVIVWAGAAFLGWIAGNMIADDKAYEDHVNSIALLHLDIDTTLFGLQIHEHTNLLGVFLGLLGAASVVLVGRWFRARLAPKDEASVVVVERAARDQV